MLQRWTEWPQNLPNCIGPTNVYQVHQMKKISALLAISTSNSPVSGEFPAQRPVTRNFDVFFDLRLNERRVNTREAGD